MPLVLCPLYIYSSSLLQQRTQATGSTTIQTTLICLTPTLTRCYSPTDWLSTGKLSHRFPFHHQYSYVVSLLCCHIAGTYLQGSRHELQLMQGDRHIRLQRVFLLAQGCLPHQSSTPLWETCGTWFSITLTFPLSLSLLSTLWRLFSFYPCIRSIWKMCFVRHWKRKDSKIPTEWSL